MGFNMANANLKRSVDLTSQKLEIIYDGECPICAYYAYWLRHANEHIQIINGRLRSELVEKAESLGLDIDKGFVVFCNNTPHAGHKGLQLLAKNSNAKGLVGFLHKVIFKHAVVTKNIYPFLVRLRNLLLRLRNKSPIQNQKIHE